MLDTTASPNGTPRSLLLPISHHNRSKVSYTATPSGHAFLHFLYSLALPSLSLSCTTNTAQSLIHTSFNNKDYKTTIQKQLSRHTCVHCNSTHARVWLFTCSMHCHHCPSLRTLLPFPFHFPFPFRFPFPSLLHQNHQHHQTRLWQTPVLERHLARSLKEQGERKRGNRTGICGSLSS